MRDNKASRSWRSLAHARPLVRPDQKDAADRDFRFAAIFDGGLVASIDMWPARSLWPDSILKIVILKTPVLARELA